MRYLLLLILTPLLISCGAKDPEKLYTHYDKKTGITSLTPEGKSLVAYCP